jgi:hypothetical protein
VAQVNSPLIVPLFFWGALTTNIIAGLFALMSGVALATENPIQCMMVILLTICVVCVAVALVRLVAEFFLVSFRASSHLFVIRKLLEDAEQKHPQLDSPREDFSRAA